MNGVRCPVTVYAGTHYNYTLHLLLSPNTNEDSVRPTPKEDTPVTGEERVVLPSGQRVSARMAERVKKMIADTRAAGGPKDNPERNKTHRCGDCIHCGPAEKPVEIMGIVVVQQTGMPVCRKGMTCVVQRSPKGKCGVEGKMFERKPAFDPTAPDVPEAPREKRPKRVPVNVQTPDEFKKDGKGEPQFPV